MILSAYLRAICQCVPALGYIPSEINSTLVLKIEITWKKDYIIKCKYKITISTLCIVILNTQKIFLERPNISVHI